jgi:proline iminopeptidase
MIKHVNRYLPSGGNEGHLCKMTQPGLPGLTVLSLLLTTTGRKSGERFIFPLFYGTDGDSYIVVASKGGAAAHPVGIATSLPTARSRCRSAPGS